MKLNASDLISRFTQNSARFLLVTSFSISLVEYFDLKPIDWPGIKAPVPIEAYELGAVLIVLFLAVSLIIHWSADYVVYTKWFKSNKFSMGTLEGLSSPKNVEGPVDGIRRRLEWLEKENLRFDGAIEKLSALDFGQIRRRESAFDAEQFLKEMRSALESEVSANRSLANTLTGLEQILDELNVRFSQVTWVTGFVVFFWYLVLPLCSSLLAVILLAI